MAMSDEISTWPPAPHRHPHIGGVGRELGTNSTTGAYVAGGHLGRKPNDG